MARRLLYPESMRYELGRILGEGGNAKVYAATDRRSGGKVALKLLGPQAEEDAVARLEREARTATAIRHPNVCATVDTGVLEDGRPFVAMELLEGESLRHMLVRDGRLDPENTLEIAVQMLAGLQAAHEAGVIHRDVKPENIFLHQAHGRMTVKVLDFGACRKIDQTLDSQCLTLAGFVVGTPGYLSPEQAYGERDLDASADLFAVGLIMFEALTGRPGFLGRTCAELMDGVHVRVPLVSQYRTIHPALEAIITRATEPVASKRYRSAAQMMHDLLEARTAMRRASYRPKVAPATNSSVNSADWDVPTQRYVA